MSPKQESGLSGAVDEAAKREILSKTTPRSKFKIVVVIDKLVEIIGVILMLGMTGLLLVNTLSRYLFNLPIPWITQLAPQLVIWISVIGMYISLRRDDLLTVRALTRRLSPKTRMWWRIVANVISAGILTVSAILGYRYLIQFGGDLHPLLRIPKGIFTSAIPIGFGVLTVVFLADTWRIWQTGPEEQSPQSSVEAASG